MTAGMMKIASDISVMYNFVHKHVGTHTHTYRFLSGCEEVGNRTSQIVEPGNFPPPRNTTVLHEFYLATTDHTNFNVLVFYVQSSIELLYTVNHYLFLLEYTPTQRLPSTHTDLYANDGATI